MQHHAIKYFNIPVLKLGWPRGGRWVQPLRWIDAACPTLLRSGLGIVLWALAGAGVGAVGAGVYGLLFGLLESLFRGEPWRVVVVSGYFALCGALAGSLVGGTGRIIDLEKGAAGDTHAPNGDGKQDAVFLRPNPLANPLIARWRFVERLAEEECPEASTPAESRSHG